MCLYHMLHFCEVWMVQQSVLRTDWSSVGVFKTNLLLCSLKHTHRQKHTDLHTCTYAYGYIQPTHTHFLQLQFVLICVSRWEGGHSDTDGWTAAWTESEGKNEGREETGWRLSVYIIHAGINASFVTAVTSTSISPPALHLLLVRHWQCNASVCVCVCFWHRPLSGQISDERPGQKP